MIFTKLTPNLFRALSNTPGHKNLTTRHNITALIESFMRLLIIAILVLSCAGSKTTHRSGGEITREWIDEEVIQKGQPVRIVYVEDDSTFQRMGHLTESKTADHVTLQYQDIDLVRIVNKDIAIHAIREITFVGASSYDRKMVGRWIKIAGFTIALLIYATIYATN